MENIQKIGMKFIKDTIYLIILYFLYYIIESRIYKQVFQLSDECQSETIFHYIGIYNEIYGK